MQLIRPALRVAHCEASRMHADERAALEMWLERNNTSPVTRQRLVPGFRRNLVLRQLIYAWEQAYA